MRKVANRTITTHTDTHILYQRFMKYKDPYVWIPLAISLAIVGGMMLGDLFSGKPYVIDYDRKLNTIFNLIADDYVDTVTIPDLVEKAVPKILTDLDPHTVYIPAKDLTTVNDELEGSFSGIGIAFAIFDDTIRVTQIVPGGPSEKAGLLAGDRIIKINDSTFVGPNLNQTDIRDKHLKGAKNTSVKLGIKRNGNTDLLNFNVVRGDVPQKSVDAAYMVEKETGYIKVNRFGRTTYDEFLNALISLKSTGAEKFIIDLRGNAGGYMEMAILMVNEFLPQNQLIVFTKGREKRNDSEVWSDGNGSFQNDEIVVLIDELSASASEIFAGAIQDNDRGLIIGRRSFGKGLVQRQFTLPDSSAIRMTISRYYTPSGRCIQKDYKHGEDEYNQELLDRYSHGELYSQDSIRIDTTQIFVTAHGRKVYGGGGIIPDIFVPNDTSGITSYYMKVANAGLLQRYAYRYVDTSRNEFTKISNYKDLLSHLPNDDVLLNDFVYYASRNGVPARWYYINISRQLLTSQLKALIAQYALGDNAFYAIFNEDDNNIDAAIKAFNKHLAEFPITEEIKNNGEIRN